MSLLLRIVTLFLLVANITLTTHANEKYHRVKIDLQGRHITELTSLGLALPAGGQKPGVMLQGEFSQSELQKITNAGFSYEILIEDMSAYYQHRNAGVSVESVNQAMQLNKSNGTPYPTPENFMLGSMGGFHTYAELLADLDDMRALYPDLISAKQPIGSGLTIQARPIQWVRISNNPDIEQDKPRVLYTALIHAREPASMQQMLFQMWYLLENYETNPEIKYLVDNTEMYFVPCVNPDGYIYGEQNFPNGGSMHRKNMRQNGDGSTGVDLNRNFGYEWGYDNSGSSPIPSDLTYRGTGPFSEPETQILKEFAETYNFDLALNNHTYSDLLIYPWGYNNQQTPDGDIFQTFAQLMTRENNYVYGTVFETLNYFANGVSDDWFYGEQETKDKTFAFTPEAGSFSDGFWPMVSRIEEICASHTHMNLSLAHLALAYGELTDLSGFYIGEKTASIPVSLKHLGLQSPAEYTISVIPLSDNIISTGDPIVVSGMQTLDVEEQSLQLQLESGIETGDIVSYVLSLSNGSFTWNDTISKEYGNAVIAFEDAFLSSQNWTPGGWGITDEHFQSAPTSITDSPNSDYPDNVSNFLILDSVFNFEGTSTLWAEFFVRYEIETGWDYAQFLYTLDNGTTWIPLAGKYTLPGTDNQDPGQPLYHGISNWVKEIVSLAAVANQPEVKFAFRLVSDGSVTGDGFYLDDFRVTKLGESSTYEITLPEAISFYQHQHQQFNLIDALNWSVSESAEVSWEGNNNLDVELLSDLILQIKPATNTFVGSEIISIRVVDGEIDVNTSLDVTIEPVPAPVILSQQNSSTIQGQSFDFEPSFLVVEDTFFTYPDDFSVTMFQGDNYLLENEYTIVPDATFTGTLQIGVIVNNGYQQSNNYPFRLWVSPASGVGVETSQGSMINYSPSMKLVSISTHSTIIQHITITDITGRILINKRTTGNEQIDVSSFQSGIYLVRIWGKRPETLKIVVQ